MTAPPAPTQAPERNGSTGQGSESALDAMLRKRREGEYKSVDELPEAPEGETASDQ